MALYEVVREIKNLCPNNQMRDVFFEEVETEDPVSYVLQTFCAGVSEITAQYRADGAVTVHAVVDGLVQTFQFTLI